MNARTCRTVTSSGSRSPHRTSLEGATRPPPRRGRRRAAHHADPPAKFATADGAVDVPAALLERLYAVGIGWRGGGDFRACFRLRQGVILGDNGGTLGASHDAEGAARRTFRMYHGGVTDSNAEVDRLQPGPAATLQPGRLQDRGSRPPDLAAPAGGRYGRLGFTGRGGWPRLVLGLDEMHQRGPANSVQPTRQDSSSSRPPPGRRRRCHPPEHGGGRTRLVLAAWAGTCGRPGSSIAPGRSASLRRPGCCRGGSVTAVAGIALVSVIG